MTFLSSLALNHARTGAGAPAIHPLAAGLLAVLALFLLWFLANAEAHPVPCPGHAAATPNAADPPMPPMQDDTCDSGCCAACIPGATLDGMAVAMAKDTASPRPALAERPPTAWPTALLRPPPASTV